MRSTGELADIARSLRNAAPQEFNRFYQAFGKYTDEVLDQIIHAPIHELGAYQGRAQQCKKIWEMFETIAKEKGDG